MKLIKEIMEMADIKALSSGFRKSQSAKDNVAAVRAGQDVVTVKGVDYRKSGSVTGAGLEKGMIVLASYNASNQGADLVEILGFTDDDVKYGDGGVKFDSVKDLFKAKGVKSLKALEELQEKNEYGHSSHLVVKDLDNGDEGPFFYLDKGRWVRGSGAEPLSFVKMEKV